MILILEPRLIIFMKGYKGMTTIDDDKIYIRSHVARDFLQSAALFKHEKQVVWEYVSNSLEYIDDGIIPLVNVTIDNRKKRIYISDNGRGMNWEDIKNFFIMHGENIDRKKGKKGRGMFGTGKCAAFGIADKLIVNSVKDNKRSIVVLNRSEIDKMSSEDPIPVEKIEKEIPVRAENGTTIIIEKIKIKNINQSAIIQYIERQISKWKNGIVYINNHECEFSEPPIVERKIFKPEGRVKEIIGDVELTIKISSSPLDEDDRGVSIYSNGIWHETTLAGNERREMSQFIFGEIDVPELDDDKSSISPYDMSRSMKLNPKNEVVRCLYSFVGQKIDIGRRQLVKEEKIRKATEEAKKLQKQANDIAEIINNDYGYIESPSDKNN